MRKKSRITLAIPDTMEPSMIACCIFVDRSTVLMITFELRTKMLRAKILRRCALSAKPPFPNTVTATWDGHSHSTAATSKLTLMLSTAIERTSVHHRSEEHTSELQSPCNLVCRLLLEKKKK